jgi:outer membrane receptor protein involved in Fe transport
VPVPAGLSANLGARHTGPQFCLHLDTGEDVALDAGTLLNGDVSRTWSLGSRRSGAFTRLQASLSVDNLTDAALYDQCGLPRPGRVFGVRMRIF